MSDNIVEVGALLLTMLEMSSQRLTELNLIQPEGVVRICQQALRSVDTRLVEHGERVAFIACEMLANSQSSLDSESLLLFQLAIFHDIGVYKIDEISRMMSLENTEGMEHSLYGYLFLKHLTPLADSAEPVLYHHTPYTEMQGKSERVRYFSQIIHVADTVDLLMLQGNPLPQQAVRQFDKLDPELVALFLATDREYGLVKRLLSGDYKKTARSRMLALCSDIETAIAYLSTLVYIVDFKSSVTVDHTINAIACAVQLGSKMGMDERGQYCLYLAALVHDIGKIAIPYEIIENPGRLSAQQMEIMKTHVVISDQILQGNISDELRRIACRHHEKPDGSGYPQSLVDSDLTLAEKVMAVADVMSALLGRRSYKESYTTARAQDIISKMSASGKLDPQVCAVAIENLAEITAVATRKCEPIISAYHSVIDSYERMKTGK